MKKTPEEKAKELVDKFTEYPILFCDAKDCAKIVVDEAIDILRVLPYGMEYLSNIDYWEEVKQEIENL